jgi:hypothetical protein
MLELAVLLKILTPALPFLAGVAGKVGEGVASKIGEDVWKQIKAKVGPMLAKHPIGQPAIAQMQAEPSNTNFQAMLELALKDLLEKDANLAAQLGELVEPDREKATYEINIQSQGNDNVNVGVNHGTIS